MSVAALFILLATVCAAAIHDARTGFIPDRYSLGGFALLLLVALANGTFASAFSGAFVSGGALALLFLITRGRGLGFGDVKLALAIGAGLGPGVGLTALGLAFIFGAAVAVALLGLKLAHRKQEIYFAPYLAAGAVVAGTAHIGGWI